MFPGAGRCLATTADTARCWASSSGSWGCAAALFEFKSTKSLPTATGWSCCARKAHNVPVREVAEESGLKVTLQEMIGVADELVCAEPRNTYYRKRCRFFRATAVGTGETAEAGYELRWMTSDAAVENLRHGSHRWAVQKALAVRVERP